MKKYFKVAVALLLIAGCGPSGGGQLADIHYEVSFPNAGHNEAEITLTISGLDPVPVQFSMSRTSPGRYALHEFAKNMYGVLAVDGQGDTLEITQPDLHNWIVSGHDGTVNFHYTLYADHADGTYSGINRQHAHLNMPATFVWPQGYETEPVSVQFNVPDGSEWRVATQLEPTNSSYRFRAPNTYYFLDSPTELSNFTMREWEVASADTSYRIRLALHHNDPEPAVDRYVMMAKKVVNEQIAIYGETPSYDYGTYTFIVDYLPYVYGDGMEHRNSTILTSTRTLKEHALENIYTLSHEYFHGWNVERIRPASLEPFNFMKANVSKVLWFGEGFTSYYDDLTVRRAGLIDDREYAYRWEGTINYVYNFPGSKFYSPVEMSMQAPFVDAATSVDAQNRSNTFISYYSWGAAIGLGLDLTLRSEFEGISLDDYMGTMWEKFGKTMVPYTLQDLEETLAQVTDSTEFARDFFSRHIYGKELVDLRPLLAEAGFLLHKAQPGEAVIDWGQNKISFENGRARVVENTLMGTPLYEAGADRDDLLLSLDGESLTDARTLQNILLRHNPGDTLTIRYESAGEEYEKTITLAENPRKELLPYENANRELKEGMLQFRQDWLGSKAGN